MKKFFLLFSLLITGLVISGCLNQGTANNDATGTGGDQAGNLDNVPPPPDPEADGDANLDTAPPPPPDPEDVAGDNDPVSTIKTFDMVAKQWDFVPSTITVNKGDTVKMIINSIDVKHGIAIPEFGVNSDLNPGEITTIEFVADKSGSFRFFCSVFCGSGHGSMEGTLIVN